MKSLVRALPVLLLSLASAAIAEPHALIMTIGAYRGGIPPLQGVKYDAESATAIARRMGVKESNIRIYRDDQLTIEGMRGAFAELEQNIGDGDQVFVYYSGHGGRERVQDPEDRCAESLITVNGDPFTDAELEAQLKRLSAKAQKMIVFLDSCHSGGVTTRAVGGARNSLVSPKYFSRSVASGEVCERPVNILRRSLSVQSRAAGSGANNYVYIAAARDAEVSLDMPGKGGVATQAWRDCITGAAVDRDGSGGLSADEIRTCAQDRINVMLKDVQGFLPHNVTISGNSNAIIAFAERPTVAIPAAVSISAPVAAAPVVAAPVAQSPRPQQVAAAPVAQPPRPQPAAQPAPPPPVNLMPPAFYTLQDIYNSRDDRRIVTLQSGKAAFKINSDDVTFSLNSSHAGYVYLMMVGTDGKTFDMLFPNQLDTNNTVEAGQTIRLPRPAWQIKAGGPAGKNQLLAIVADAPRDYSKIGMTPAGPFSMVQANVTSSKDIQLVSSTSSQANSNECGEPPAKRSLQVQKRCSSAYGAAMMVLEEVN